MAELLKHEIAHGFLLAKLEATALLSNDDRQALSQLRVRVREFDAGATIVVDGERPSECGLVLDGLVYRHKLLGDGRRQILAFHVPGDIPDLQSLHVPVMDHSLGALTPTKVAFFAHADLRSLLQDAPALAGLFWRETLVDAAIFRVWMVGLGRRSAYGRLAHLFCELATKLRQAGLGRGESFPLPVTQQDLGDALGLSTVHVNRVLQQLRKARVVEVRSGRLTVLDWEKLAEIGEFSPDYLRQSGSPRSFEALRPSATRG